MSAVKVKTYPIIPPSWTTTTLEAFYPKRSLPFTKSSMSGRMHRVRWVIAFQPLMRGGAELLPARLVPRTWCGTSMVRGHLYADPGDWEICGTCEGRAIGAGQIPTPPGYTTDLIFEPRPNARCGWWVRGYSTMSSWSGGRVCDITAKYIAARDEATVHVCTRHSRIAAHKGWTISEANR